MNTQNRRVTEIRKLDVSLMTSAPLFLPIMKSIASLLFLAGSIAVRAAAADQPNIVFILADDMGYGDVSHAGGKIPTPNLDRLRAEGMRFTDAHTTSSVCTPTRYGILTGRYNWRSSLKKHVLFPPDRSIMDPKRPTIASFLKERGYRTCVVGKWHLGLNWHMLEQPAQAAICATTRRWEFPP